MAQYDFNLRDYWYVLRKRKITVIASAILLVVLSLLFSMIRKKELKYKSVASVKIEKSTTLAGLFVEALSYNSGDTVATQATVIKSYPVMEEAAKKLGLIDHGQNAETIRKDPTMLQTILSLEQMIDTEREGYTNIVHITAKASDPVFAQNLANATAEAFRHYSFMESNKRILEAKKFIEAQLAQVQVRLREAEEKLKNFRETHEVVALDTQAAASLNRLVQVENDLRMAQKKREEFAAFLQHAQAKKPLEIEPSRIPSVDDLGPTFTTLRGKLVDLTLERDTLLTGLTPNHPKVFALDDEIAEVAAALVREVSSQEKAAAGRENSLAGEMGYLKKAVGAIPEANLTLIRLEREVRGNEKIHAQLASKYQEALIKDAEKIEDVTIIRPALGPGEPVNPPSPVSTSLLGLVVGVMLGSIAALVMENIDTSFGAVEDIESFLKVPVLSVIPRVDMEEIHNKAVELSTEGDRGNGQEMGLERLLLLLMPNCLASENFRVARTNLNFACLSKGMKAVEVTSASGREGKTTVTVNLAIACAQAGMRTILVDGDLRKPEIHRVFGLDRGCGLSDVILGNVPWKATVLSIFDVVLGKYQLETYLLSPGMDQLHLITAGSYVENPPELLDSPKMVEFLTEVKNIYDVVLVDAPPVLPAVDACIWGSKMDAAIMVYEFGRVGRRPLQHAKARLDQVKANLCGVIINGLRAEVSPDFYEVSYYRSSKYGYTYSEKAEAEPAQGAIHRVKEWMTRPWSLL